MASSNVFSIWSTEGTVELTMDSDRLLQRKDEFLYEMERIRMKQGLDSVVLMLTDVLLEGTQLLFLGDEEVISQAFGVTPKDNMVFLPRVMSRKKQVVPMLWQGIHASRDIRSCLSICRSKDREFWSSRGRQSE